MIKKELILKDKNIKIKIHQDYLEFTKNSNYMVIAYKFIANIYLNKQADVPLNILINLAKKVPLYIIDHNGYVVAEVKVNVQN